MIKKNPYSINFKYFHTQIIHTKKNDYLNKNISIMVYNYIYIISFEERTEIYIGRTNNIKRRFLEHKQIGPVCEFYQKEFKTEYINSDWSKMYIDIIDSINMDDRIFLYISKNIIKIKDLNKKALINEKLVSLSYVKLNDYFLTEKLKYTELFHICYYNSKTKYWLLNKQIPTDIETIFEWYKFYNC